jgi:predicted nuclease with TOPRIM domain
VNILINHYHKKLSTLVNQNILLEAKMESMTKDYMDLKQKFDELQSPKRGIKK